MDQGLEIFKWLGETSGPLVAVTALWAGLSTLLNFFLLKKMFSLLESIPQWHEAQAELLSGMKATVETISTALLTVKK